MGKSTRTPSSWRACPSTRLTRTIPTGTLAGRIRSSETTARVLTRYKAKHEQALREGNKNTKFLLGHQEVRRGQAILKFLEDGPIHPYQIVGKRWMTRGITTYHSLFRLANTIEELENFKIGVKPVDWLRQRLYDIMQAESDRFSLANTMKDMYNDEKLQMLRRISGFSNLGRPFKVEGGGRGRGGFKRKTGTPTRPPSRRIKMQKLGTAAPIESRLAGLESGLELESEPEPDPGE